MTANDLPGSNNHGFERALIPDHMLGEYGLVLATASNYAGAQANQIRIPTGYSDAVTQDALALLAKGIEEYAG